MDGERVALITGAGTGVGRAVAIALIGAGYALVLAGRRRAPLEETAQEAQGRLRALVVEADVSDPRSVRNLFAETERTFGRIDLLFNNAGVGAPPLPPPPVRTRFGRFSRVSAARGAPSLWARAR